QGRQVECHCRAHAVIDRTTVDHQTRSRCVERVGHFGERTCEVTSGPTRKIAMITNSHSKPSECQRRFISLERGCEQSCHLLQLNLTDLRQVECLDLGPVNPEPHLRTVVEQIEIQLNVAYCGRRPPLEVVELTAMLRETRKQAPEELVGRPPKSEHRLSIR